ncbi:helix-turn-helix domain-containing protein [Mesorhizobium sp. M1A.F.Ca.IN.020.03.2.1]|uniref:HTH domain-containing protein n=1 Tax=Mesorhizobium sp. M1A.F.Ca.IN.020.03.2.1 TaxID=2496769 RepID=UPI000FD526C9|nr:helix-turn-helix domain-containing protein [Mesorhizobium sp. M1A.F.Ca.IN.020.03.2.1]RUV07988.1 helix-turn-helix domain-containing protein [Mesorhizobium sp. M1A.F.Ca.IN.020.03.2.1]
MSSSVTRAGAVLAALEDHQIKTADKLAASVGVSPRTIYRYMRDLRAAGHPILSEAGLGYQLRRERTKREVAQP